METLLLSKEARSLWAKTGRDEQLNLWEPLYVHMLDSAALAEIIWDEWLSDSVRSLLLGETGLEEHVARSLVSFLAGVHDIGKATPNFQSKVLERAEAVRVTGLEIPPSVPKSLSHAYMGELILERWLEERGWSRAAASASSSPVGGHHGANPSNGALKGIVSASAVRPSAAIGDDRWQRVQDELLWLVFEFSGVSEFEGSLDTCELPACMQVLLNGLIIMVDWIASNTRYFPLVEGIDCSADVRDRALVGWRGLSIPCAEQFGEELSDPETAFRRRFPSLPDDARLRPVQMGAWKAAQSADSPCLMIIEAPMGCGKTEASLLAAEVLASKFSEGGLAYLLPTQATSNAMYARVESWLESVHSDYGPDMYQDIHLLHGKAALNESWRSRISWGDSWMGDGGDTDDAIIAHQWFNGRKRGLLAPFVVGTVDQLLFMALRAKHVHLRHLGLAGKVVVIDEVHAYDAYMSVYLDRALWFLGKYQVPVVLLSATLPPKRRQQLVNAYRGLDMRKSRRKKPLQSVPRAESGAPQYPLIICSSSDRREEPAYISCASDGRSTEFEIERIPDDDESLVELLSSVLVHGGCVCVLRNTVRRAQETYRLLSERLQSEVMLVHSRFIAADRSKNDSLLLELLGPDSSKRPKSLVVVGTQVIEQSLDIDFDMLITDIAPVDLLFQRMGRVHRHSRGKNEEGRPRVLRNARCAITGIESWANGLPEFEEGTAFVYQPALLYRTLLALHLEHGGARRRVSIPDDIAPLVECVYDYEDDALEIPDAWEEKYRDAFEGMIDEHDEKEGRADDFLLKHFPRHNLDGWMDNKTKLEDEVHGAAKVRDSQDSIEVFVIVGGKGGYELLPWVAEDRDVPAALGSGDDTPSDEIARTAALCTVCLPPVLCKPFRIDAVISALEESGAFEAWQLSPWLKGMLPLVIDGSGDAVINITVGKEAEREEAFRLHYSRTEGLSCEREGDES